VRKRRGACGPKQSAFKGAHAPITRAANCTIHKDSQVKDGLDEDEKKKLVIKAQANARNLSYFFRFAKDC
jgi:hypothetical protein